ncbi:MAG: VIT and VWA domain-containing protein, partial [Bryobacteraceae bacterium]
TLPLPQNAAVDDMTIRVGDRTVKGRIKRREEARAIYEAARGSGRTAALLDQERPNIFTQAVANIRPHEKVTVIIQYVETLKYENGAYDFVFPMVVGPRYTPRSQASTEDAARIAPPVTAKGTRAGHDITIGVTIDAGVPIQFLRSLTHDIDIQRPSPRQAVLSLRNKSEIPNKDFVLEYDVSGKGIEDALLAHHDARGGFFSLILQPPAKVTPREVAPKELVFVIDTSGSMMGYPLEKVKEAMRHALTGMNPRDTFNVITFSGDTHILFPQPVPASAENVQRAQSFLDGRRGSGGTEMMKAIRAALDPSDLQDHLRIACFMTDGYVGNDMEIIAEVQKHKNARVFSFGIGSSVNRFLLDKMAEYGRGEVEYVSLEDDGSAAAKRFHERVRNPLLTDVTVEWAGMPVSDIYPRNIPDLFSAKPVVLSGRYNGSAKGVIRLRGRMGGRDFSRDIPVTLPATEAKNESIATLWARRKVDDLMGQDWAGAQRGTPNPAMREEVTKTGLDFRLMTQFTSFVAVEESIVTEGGRPRRIEIPVEMPHGVQYEASTERRSARARTSHRPAAETASAASPSCAPSVRNRCRRFQCLMNSRRSRSRTNAAAQARRYPSTCRDRRLTRSARSTPLSRRWRLRARRRSTCRSG